MNLNPHQRFGAWSLTLGCILRLMTSDQLQPRPGPGLRLLLAQSRQCSPLHKVHSSFQLSPSRAKQPRARMQSLPQCLIVLLWLGTDCLMPSQPDHCLIFPNSLKVILSRWSKDERNILPGILIHLFEWLCFTSWIVEVIKCLYTRSSREGTQCQWQCVTRA